MTTTIDHADIRWRVSNTWDKGATKMGMLVGYIDARTCMDALDALDPNWSAVHGAPIVVGNELMGVPCALTVNGITRSDVGMPSSQEPIKGAYSDALKRAAVHHNIGRELYELPKIAVECDVRNGKVKGPKALPTYRDGRWIIDRQYGWVKYDREPEEQPERLAGGSPSSPKRAAPASQYRRSELAALMGKHHLALDAIEAKAEAIGIPADELPMSDASMDRLIAAIEQGEAERAQGSASPSDTPPAEGHPEAGSAAATARDSEDAGSPPAPSSESASAVTMEDVLEAAGPGAAEVAPLPDVDPEGYRAWFERQPREERMRLRSQGRAPAPKSKAKVTA